MNKPSYLFSAVLLTLALHTMAAPVADEQLQLALPIQFYIQ
ncbi:hypothetical protein [Bacterioplanoides pacificum]|uniref:Uncharacterized protein n=1 Tax=Bacterioplanoides pacificum TaxID=1171596 RepID=A0ABV7VYW0_9GAMM